MTNQRRTVFAAGVIGLTLLVGAGWAASAWSDAADAADAAAADGAACEKAAAAIERLRAAPGAAGTVTGATIADRVAAALDKAEIDPAGQGRLAALPPRPTGAAGVVELPAVVSLHHVKLRQALAFAANVAPADGGLVVRGVKLTSAVDGPDDPAEADDWDAAVTVAYRVASSDNPPRTGGGE